MKEEARMKIVREALAGIKVGVLARIYDVHPESIRQWVRDHVTLFHLKKYQ